MKCQRGISVWLTDIPTTRSVPFVMSWSFRPIQSVYSVVPPTHGSLNEIRKGVAGTFVPPALELAISSAFILLLVGPGYSTAIIRVISLSDDVSYIRADGELVPQSEVHAGDLAIFCTLLGVTEGLHPRSTFWLV